MINSFNTNHEYKDQDIKASKGGVVAGALVGAFVLVIGMIGCDMKMNPERKSILPDINLPKWIMGEGPK